ASVPIYFRNDSGAVYRHPQPIEPSELRAGWRSPSGELLFAGRARGLLPLVLVRGEIVLRPIELELPRTPRDYLVEVSIAAEPERVVGNARVRVRPAPANPAAS